MSNLIDRCMLDERDALHFCSAMTSALRSPNNPLVLMEGVVALVKSGGAVPQIISYCPHCGGSLRVSLKSEITNQKSSIPR